MEYKGLKAPLQANKNGGLATEIDSDQTKKIIMLALNFCPSENPFNDDVGIDYPVFDINDVSTQSRLARRIKKVFNRLEDENRAKLSQYTFTSKNEEIIVDIQYLDMLTDRSENLQYTPSGGGA